jgi:hypothetical protein
MSILGLTGLRHSCSRWSRSYIRIGILKGMSSMVSHNCIFVKYALSLLQLEVHLELLSSTMHPLPKWRLLVFLNA